MQPESPSVNGSWISTSLASVSSFLPSSSYSRLAMGRGEVPLEQQPFYWPPHQCWRLGGALFISVGQTVFQNGLVRRTHQFSPDLDPKLPLNVGATMIRTV